MTRVKQRLTVRDALAFGRSSLRRHACSKEGDREAEALLIAATGMSRERLWMHSEQALSPSSAAKYKTLIGRRLAHEPLDYILGFTPFFGHEFRVTHATLIPRWASENVVAAGLDAVANWKSPLIVDVGTGSGCLALSAAAARPDAEVWGTDMSAAAIAVARGNARRLGLTATFRVGDLLTPASRALAAPRPSLIFANLPYLTTGDLKNVTPDIRRFEPESALLGVSRDGLGDYRRLLDDLKGMNRAAPTAIAFEFLPRQCDAVARAVHARFPNAVTAPIHQSGSTVGMVVVSERAPAQRHGTLNSAPSR